MPSINTNLFIPEDIQAGLDAGQYIRKGGVIREVGTQRIVRLLKEGPAQISQALSNLSTLGSVASLLNVAVSIAGFAMVLAKLGAMDKKLDKILDKLEQMSDKLDNIEAKVDQIHHKLDAQSRANFLHAIEQLQLALNMKHDKNREALLYRVVDRLGEARQLFFSYFQDAPKIEIATEYANFYLLSSLSQSIAYLELDETEAAQRIIKQITTIHDDHHTCQLMEVYVSKVKANLEKREIKDIVLSIKK
ncbi:hypothetical protein [Synechococcus sp. PCC 6312]|uniref:hypothetical protein n=1 Tax=Synechococcus sp. (strain ATCC 27167 / PCC 6312) TaxID=195253 RepID=UPI00029F1C6D|nr:hypothetical protein [Synechococcus sp. PCC 6312]AFY62307.1 hypothetical protein Syn6312_3263 [Synechococcus sp. PCC 6312]